MKLYLVQHAKAVPKKLDTERPLTKEGIDEIRNVAQFLKPLTLRVDYLWYSSKKRAAQTADILAEVVAVSKERTMRNDLGPNDDVTTITSELASNTKDIMIVGHLPFLSKLASLLLTGSELTDIVEFKNAAVVCLDRSEENRWQIEWIVLPQLLAPIAASQPNEEQP
jgi:phosphohistidine phosphatase